MSMSSATFCDIVRLLIIFLYVTSHLRGVAESLTNFKVTFLYEDLDSKYTTRTMGHAKDFCWFFKTSVKSGEKVFHYL